MATPAQTSLPASLLAALILAACAPQLPAPSPTITAIPSPNPTVTPSPIPTLTPTAAHQPESLTPTATPAFRTMQLEWAKVSLSPDGKWRAKSEVWFPLAGSGQGQAYTQLVIASIDASVYWQVLDRWTDVGLGFPLPAPYRWSIDGRWLYYSNHVFPDGAGWLPFLAETDLVRVSLDDGSAQPLFGGNAENLALSPRETRLAYVRWDRTLVIHDIASGQSQEVSLPVEVARQEFDAGAIVWSPDGSELVLTIAYATCPLPLQGTETGIGFLTPQGQTSRPCTSILRLALPALTLTTLYDMGKTMLYTLDWNESGVLLDAIEVNEGGYGQLPGLPYPRWRLDLNSGGIELIN